VGRQVCFCGPRYFRHKKLLDIKLKNFKLFSTTTAAPRANLQLAGHFIPQKWPSSTFELENLVLEQACQTGGLRAACCPFACFVQPK
jgi:hypothetical protein